MPERGDYCPQNPEETGLQIIIETPEETPKKIIPPRDHKIEGEVIDWLKKVGDGADREWQEKNGKKDIK